MHSLSEYSSQNDNPILIISTLFKISFLCFWDMQNLVATLLFMHMQNHVTLLLPSKMHKDIYE